MYADLMFHSEMDRWPEGDMTGDDESVNTEGNSHVREPNQ